MGRKRTSGHCQGSSSGGKCRDRGSISSRAIYFEIRQPFCPDHPVAIRWRQTNEVTFLAPSSSTTGRSTFTSSFYAADAHCAPRIWAILCLGAVAGGGVEIPANQAI